MTRCPACGIPARGWDYRADIDGPQSNGMCRWVTGWSEVPDAGA